MNNEEKRELESESAFALTVFNAPNPPCVQLKELAYIMSFRRNEQ